MKNILIFSNNAASMSESNGRIHMTQFLSYENIWNFYIRGIPDIPNIQYIHFSYKDAIKMKLGFNRQPVERPESNNVSNSSDSKGGKPFYHYCRNKIFTRNNKIINHLKKTIDENQIGAIVVWGTDIPFLYEYAYKLSNECNVPLITVTGENYPLKKYNYISQKPNLFFNCFQKALYKWANKAYLFSSANIYFNNELKEAYEKEFGINNGHVVYFGSSLKPVTRRSKKITNVFYGGNLYKDRAMSLIEVAHFLSDYESITINVYGRCEKELIAAMSECKNIIYHGSIPYDELIKKMYDSDLLLHVEGFSSDCVNDFEYAFSTKIADYMATRLPFFCYGPEKISGIKFLYNLNPQIVAISNNELYKIKDIINGKVAPIKGHELFDSSKASEKVANIIEGV